MTGTVSLRDVEDRDLREFYEHQADPIASTMAGVPSRDLEAHLAHWKRLLADSGVAARTVVVDGMAVGSVLSFDRGGVREVGYWIDRAVWGRGIASAALAQFLEVEVERPLHAIIAAYNRRSRRVVERCGFALASAGTRTGVCGHCRLTTSCSWPLTPRTR